MIPDDLDDGFSYELQTGVVCRPMLWAQHREWKAAAAESPEDALRAILRPPYLFSVFSPHDAEAKLIVQTVMDYPADVEQRDLQSLADSASLQTTNPGMSLLQCDDCRKYCVDHETGEVQRQMNGVLKQLPPGCEVPCETRMGCPKGHYNCPKGLSVPRWVKTWKHFWRYRDQPTENLVADPIFVRNRMLLNWIVDYGRDTRFDPFAGVNSRRGVAAVTASGTDVADGSGQGSP